MRAPFSPAQKVILHLHQECTRCQQDLTLTEANKLTCMPHWRSELTKCVTVLKLHRPQSSLLLKMAMYYPDFHPLSILRLFTWGIAWSLLSEANMAAQRSIWISIHCPFYVWLCEVLHKVYCQKPATSSAFDPTSATWHSPNQLHNHFDV